MMQPEESLPSSQIKARAVTALSLWGWDGGGAHVHSGISLILFFSLNFFFVFLDVFLSSSVGWEAD